MLFQVLAKFWVGNFSRSLFCLFFYFELLFDELFFYGFDWRHILIFSRVFLINESEPVAFIEKGLGKDSEVAFKLNIVFDECGKLMLEHFEFWEILFIFVLFLFLLDIWDGFFIKKSITSALFSSICKNFYCINDVLNKVISGDFDGWDLVFFDFYGLEFVGLGLLPNLASEIASRLIVCETVGLSKY